VIVNLEEDGVADLLAAAATLPTGKETIRRLREGDEAFSIVTGRAGLEWGVRNEIKGAPNRARLKLFVPAERDGIVVLFAYKPSQVSWSSDRYAYGAWEIPVAGERATIDLAELEAWLAFQVSGFHPEKRPRSLLRQITYDIPE